MEIINLREREDLLGQMAEILRDGFYNKFSSILGEDESFHEAMKIIINRDMAYGVLKHGTLMGVAVLETEKIPAVIYPFKKIKKVLGFWRGIRAALMLHIIFGIQKIDGDTLKLEILGVKKSSRGEGIGSRLLKKTDEVARELGVKRVILDVIDTNPRAKKLYQKYGYIEKEFMNTSKMTRKLGFTGIYKMEKKL